MAGGYSKYPTIGVWWDIKTCPVPDGLDPSRVHSALIKYLGPSPVTIFAVGNLEDVSPNLLEAISSSGILIRHTPCGGMDVFYLLLEWKKRNPSASKIMLISGHSSWFIECFYSLDYDILRAFPDPRFYHNYYKECLWENLLKENSGDHVEEKNLSNKDEPTWFCQLCNIPSQNCNEFIKHLKSREHKDEVSIEEEVENTNTNTNMVFDVPIPIPIFWDAEKAPLPDDVHAHQMLGLIQTALHQIDVTIHVVVRQPSKLKLTDHQFYNQNPPPPSISYHPLFEDNVVVPKQAVEGWIAVRLLELINQRENVVKEAVKYNVPPPSAPTVILIAGNKNYRPLILRLRNLGFTVLVFKDHETLNRSKLPQISCRYNMAEDYSMFPPTSVWWDINTCPVPTDFDPRRIRTSIESALRKYIGPRPVTIFAVGSLENISPDVLEAISSTGILLRSIFFRRRELKDFIDRYRKHNPPPAKLMLISGDSLWFDPNCSDFSGYTILRAFPNPRRLAYRTHHSVKEWFWKNLLKENSEETRLSKYKLKDETPWLCYLCDIPSQSYNDFIMHLKSEEHKEEMFDSVNSDENGRPNRVCELCQYPGYDDDTMGIHYNSDVHKQNVENKKR